MQNPVCLYPCLHNFCESCYLNWKERSTECPICRVQVIEVNKSSLIKQLSDIFFKTHPEKKILIEKCKQCEEKIDNFLCAPNQKHIKCKQCSILMPKRKDYKQQCENCKEFFCNLYFYECSNGLEFIENLCNKEISITPGCFNNAFEENILIDYVRINKLTRYDIINNIIQQGLCQFTLKSVVCFNCSGKIWNDILENFRNTIKDKLPQFIQKKSYCSKGKDCMLQYSILHTQIYNHI